MGSSEIFQKGKEASRKLALTSSKVKNYALERMAEALDKNATGN